MEILPTTMDKLELEKLLPLEIQKNYENFRFVGADGSYFLLFEARSRAARQIYTIKVLNPFTCHERQALTRMKEAIAKDLLLLCFKTPHALMINTFQETDNKLAVVMSSRLQSTPEIGRSEREDATSADDLGHLRNVPRRRMKIDNSTSSSLLIAERNQNEEVRLNPEDFKLRNDKFQRCEKAQSKKICSYCLFFSN